MNNLFLEDSLFQGLKENLVEIGKMPRDNFSLLSPTFWETIDPAEISTKTVCCILSLYFTRKGLSKGAYKYRDAAASDLGIDFHSPNMKNIGLKRKREIIDSRTPFGLYVPKKVLVQLMNACFNKNGWSIRALTRLDKQLTSKFNRSGDELDAQFLLESPFVYNRFCPKFAQMTPLNL